MAKRKRKKDEDDKCDELSAGEMPQQLSRETDVPYHRKPAPGSKNKKIHPRQKLPPVPKGKDRPDDSPSPPVDLD